MDGLQDRTGPKPTLIYPFEGPPARGQALEVAPGVHWIRMPLPFALNHINLWAIDDGDGWAMVDTGVRTEETVARLARAVRQRARRAAADARLRHPHASRPRRHGRLADAQVRRAAVDDAAGVPDLPRHGVRHRPRGARRRRSSSSTAPAGARAAIETYRARFGNFGKHIHALPDSYRRLTTAKSCASARTTWRVVVGNGHSPEHACLYCPELKLLISGDQVLPRISSNVSVHPTEPDADPMADWLASLAKLKREVPDDVLVLPAHNECFRGLHARIDTLARGQETPLARLRRSLREPKRAVDVFGALFARADRRKRLPLLGMATGESLACLNYLLHRGEVTRSLDADGVAWYRLAAT